VTEVIDPFLFVALALGLWILLWEMWQ
jgi:hypothetical protein